MTSEPPPFEILVPSVRLSPFLFNSPHSGRHYPADFLARSRLDARAIRQSEDMLVDLLFEGAVAAGAPLIRATFPRAYIDLNREPFELDPKLFCERLPAHANQRSLRVAGGLGTIPRLVAETQDIYPGPIPLAEGLSRIETVYRPYHAALRGLVCETVARFGSAVLVDCHSMPALNRASGTEARADFVIGDRFGTSCPSDLAEAAAAILADLGYSVARNRPYAGGFITEHYGRPAMGVHALQIEVNRALYMDEAALDAHEGFDRLKGDLDVFVARLVASQPAVHPAYRDAAE